MLLPAAMDNFKDEIFAHKWKFSYFNPLAPYIYNFRESKECNTSVEKVISTTDCFIDYYAVLGVSTYADFATLKRAYYSRSLASHPDKSFNSAFSTIKSIPYTEESYINEVDAKIESRTTCIGDYDTFQENLEDSITPLYMNSSNFSDECVVDFCLLKEAYDTLSDVVSRLKYDVSAGIITDACTLAMRSSEAISVKRDKCQLYCSQIFDEYIYKLDDETRKNGLIIIKALFGNLRAHADSWADLNNGDIEYICDEDLVGPFIDVTVAMQCMAEKSKIIFKGSEQGLKIEDLPGFYNPIPHKLHGQSLSLDAKLEPWLYVLYQFRNKYHEFTMRNASSFSIPMKAHLPTGTISGPMPAANFLAQLDSENDDDDLPHHLQFFHTDSLNYMLRSTK